ncbi:hypothetical protein Lfu02_14960 [Longispora fulva]|uniref:Uncharacterized protein n=1 Tax=Longispora fulva TaxID=619741 RepID=A0A8J7KMH5_9ACTN|nr:hypothetical protein [Longispora fulva]MBG6140494.1 hypothetical protein [Longispora fulva]GIG57124.1 hypothetical protein Lfu02_14960 [Longispora fulva]
MTPYNWPAALVLLTVITCLTNVIVHLFIGAVVSLAKGHAALRGTAVPEEVRRLELRSREVWRGGAVVIVAALTLLALVLTPDHEGWAVVGPWLPPALGVGFLAAGTLDVRAFRREAKH